jgi:hypothetical protein
MANESFGISSGTYALDKSKIKFLLLEGVHFPGTRGVQSAAPPL